MKDFRLTILEWCFHKEIWFIDILSIDTYANEPRSLLYVNSKVIHLLFFIRIIYRDRK